jgi:hypothetical protein
MVESAAMDNAHDWPIITPCLVFPFVRTCEQGSHRYPALVFAERGRVVLYAAEYARRFGVGIVDDKGNVTEADQFATLDDAARVFLRREAA